LVDLVNKVDKNLILVVAEILGLQKELKISSIKLMRAENELKRYKTLVKIAYSKATGSQAALGALTLPLTKGIITK